MNIQRPLLISIVGPTATGKTDLSVDLAEHLGTEILSADSRQFFREMEIGTAKPSKEQQRRVRHHFIDSLSIHDDYSAGRFETDALQVLEEVFFKSKYAVMVGGSGLYLSAAWEGMDEMPPIDQGIRLELNDIFRNQGLEPLLAELLDKDPVYYGQVDRKNHQRVIRALEMIRATGHPFSAFRKDRHTVVNRPFDLLKIGLQMDKEELDERIDERMDAMISKGLFEEARGLFPYRGLNALQTVGYQEIFGFLAGEYEQDEAIRLLKRNSRRYAKRQMTWFRKYPDIHWLDAPGSLPAILELLSKQNSPL
jgi:tRNA dimethylallyltransferase